MMIVNVPFAIAWFLMYQASDVSHLFIANSLLGLSVGLMEAPIMTYLGEISEPATRGILISYTNLGTPLGGFVVNFLNTLTKWRTVGLICLSVPILTIIALTFVPETPHWLIGKGRMERAERALCWLRYKLQPFYYHRYMLILLRVLRIKPKFLFCFPNKIADGCQKRGSLVNLNGFKHLSNVQNRAMTAFDGVFSAIMRPHHFHPN